MKLRKWLIFIKIEIAVGDQIQSDSIHYDNFDKKAFPSDKNMEKSSGINLLCVITLLTDADGTKYICLEKKFKTNNSSNTTNVCLFTDTV